MTLSLQCREARNSRRRNCKRQVCTLRIWMPTSRPQTLDSNLNPAWKREVANKKNPSTLSSRSPALKIQTDATYNPKPCAVPEAPNSRIWLRFQRCTFDGLHILHIHLCMHVATKDTANICVHTLFGFLTFQAKLAFFEVLKAALQQHGDRHSLWFDKC